MGTFLSQMWPPAPTLTEQNLPPQTGRVFMVTGGYSGVGLALTRMLYLAGGIVYVAGRSEQKARRAIESLDAEAIGVVGRLHFLHLDLSDLRTIKPAVEAFLRSETRLDVLFNNAGVSSTPSSMRTVQRLELQMGTNAVAHYLLAELLQPILTKTARSSSPGSVRVIWTASLAVEQQAPVGGLVMDHLDHIPSDRFLNYANSKTANVLLCSELGKRSLAEKLGILHVVQNPGNLSTNLLRNLPRTVYWLVRPLLYDASYGAYTALWCGFSEELQLHDDQGAYIIPWGRRHPDFRQDILAACKSEGDGGSGVAYAVRAWCDAKVSDYQYRGTF